MFRQFLRKFIILRKSLRENYAEIVSYKEPSSRRDVFRYLLTLGSSDFLMSNSEAYQLYTLVKSVSKIQGDIAEVGVYKGRSARLMLEASGRTKHLHLFDTFSGLPKPTKEDLKEHDFQEGEYYASKTEVEKYLSDVATHVTLYEGVFPHTADPVKDLRFSFVNIDVDLYQGTHDALSFFYPRMNPGGVIVSHDYVSDGGVRDAIINFFKDKQEPVFEVGAGSQAFIVKI